MSRLKGQLSLQPLARVLAEIQARGRSGVLKLSQGAMIRQIFIENGKIVRYAASNLLAESLSEQLKHLGRFRKEDMTKATTAKERSELLSSALWRLGLITEDEHRNLVHGVIKKVVDEAAASYKASFEYQIGELPFTQPGDAGIPISTLILHLVREMKDLNPLQDLLGGGRRKIRINPSPPLPLEAVPLQPDEGYLVSRADGGMTIHEVGITSPLGPEGTNRALCALILAGILVTEGGEEEAAPSMLRRTAPGAGGTGEEAVMGPTHGNPALQPRPKPAGPVVEMLERFDALREQNFYQVLGVSSAADASEIRQSYYALAKRLHPDKFFEEETKDRAEKLFAAITEAYATLSRPQSRKVYDESAIFNREKQEPNLDSGSELARQNFLRGKTLYQGGEFVKSLAFFKNAVGQDDGKEEYWHYLGLVQSRNPRMRKEAEQSFVKAIQLDPSRAENYAQLGLLYRKMGLAEKSREHLQQALKWDGANATAREALSEVTKRGGLKSLFGK